MAHHHHEDDTYFLDQICMVALSGAFGVICLCMYFVQQSMLFRLLAPQFHPFVLASGIALLLIAIVRAGMLWSMAGTNAPNLGHSQSTVGDEHDPGHDHAHSHGDGGHEHGHAHAHGHEHAHSHGHASPSHSHSHSHAADHDHGHSHAIVAESRAFGHTPAPAHSHAHDHGHSHGDGDHEHGWAPWRYVLLLIPIIFFLLGIPNKGPSFDVGATPMIETHDPKEEAAYGVTLTGLGNAPWGPIGVMLARQAADAVAADVEFVNVKQLEALAGNAADRDYYKGKSIKVRGQYIPRSERFFEVGRFKIQCCAGDAIAIRIPVIAKDGVAGLKEQDWIEVVGRVEFRQTGADHKTVIIVGDRNQVKKCNADPNPYVQ